MSTSQTYPIVPGTNMVLCTLCNYGYLDFTKNLLHSLQTIPQLHGRLVIGCADPKAATQLTQEGASNVRYVADRPISTFQRCRESIDEWREVVRNKFLIIMDILNAGRDVLFVDSDVVFLKNPIPAIVAGTVGLDLVGQRSGSHTDRAGMCTGFFFLRNTPLARKHFHVDRFDQSNFKGDQDYVNAIRDVFKHGLFNRKQFPVGKHFYADPVGMRETALIVHFNYVKGLEKKALMKQFDMWNN